MSESAQLVSVGEVRRNELEAFVEPLHSVLELEAVVMPLGLPAPTYAFNKDRGQYHTTAILRRLKARASGQLVLGVTELDLFDAESPWLYGAADRELGVAIMSLHRMQQHEAGWRRRALTEAVHNAGHLLGLANCEDVRCAMFSTSCFTDCERRKPQLCSNCRGELTRLAGWRHRRAKAS